MPRLRKLLALALTRTRPALSLAAVAPLLLWTGSSQIGSTQVGSTRVGSPLSSNSQPPLRIPSNVAWTKTTLDAASRGNPVRGLLISRRCEHCHGHEGFSQDASVPNLAGMPRLTMWKQLNDFRDGKRTSPVMQSVIAVMTTTDFADLAAYFSMLPAYSDPQDQRAFPQPPPPLRSTTIARRLIQGGDGPRGIPPCQVCHGPLAWKTGAPSLLTQNATYIQKQLEAFATGGRTNDINMPMRSIAPLLTPEEREALAAYYGADLAEIQTNPSPAQFVNAPSEAAEPLGPGH